MKSYYPKNLSFSAIIISGWQNKVESRWCKTVNDQGKSVTL